MKNEYYLINFNETDATLEIYNTEGFDDGKCCIFTNRNRTN